MLALAAGNSDLRHQLSESGDIAAEVLFGIHGEMALTLDDVVMRRTGIGQLGNPGQSVLETCARLLGSELDWSEERRNSEITAVEQNFRTAAA